MQNIRQKYTRMKEKLEKRVFDTYLLKYIEKPMIDEDKLLILISMMDFLKLPLKKMENYCLATMLIQIALDTHEHINEFSEDGKSRQLTVLAGDYYSGLYYKLLAETKDVLIIKGLSAGVKEINEHKIILYGHDSDNIEKLMTSVKAVESSILKKLAQHFKLDDWINFLENFLLFKRLLTEKSLFIKKESSIIFDGLKKAIFSNSDLSLTELKAVHRDQLIAVCDRYLDYSKQVIENKMLDCEYFNDFLRERISFLLKQHQSFAKTFVEEG